jgi:hypothetical protein
MIPCAVTQHANTLSTMHNDMFHSNSCTVSTLQLPRPNTPVVRTSKRCRKYTTKYAFTRELEYSLTCILNSVLQTFRPSTWPQNLDIRIWPLNSPKLCILLGFVSVEFIFLPKIIQKIISERYQQNSE